MANLSASTRYFIVLVGTHLWMETYFVMAHVFVDWVAFFSFSALVGLQFVVDQLPNLSQTYSEFARASLTIHCIAYSFFTFYYSFFTMRFNDVYVWWQIIAIILPFFAPVQLLAVKRQTPKRQTELTVNASIV